MTLVIAPREHDLGNLVVRRAVPTLQARSVGPFVFVDHMGPAVFEPGVGIDVRPHPHIGLATVTYLFEGEILHRDSLGSEQPIRPGQLNLMTAGRGVSHSEESLDWSGRLQGIQLWVAQPEATRHGPAAFEHHDTLPQVELDGATATVLVGAFGGVRSPARADTELVGVDLVLRGPTTHALDPSFEHALVVIEGAVQVGGQDPVGPGHLVYLAPGHDELPLAPVGPTRLLVLGGVPFESPILMWWNFVARTREEVDEATREWNAGSDRFGDPDSPLPRIPAPATPW
jgi:redox-sensitive bicupin YhaK (pirin superfamily)